jgi:hypothetical protein
VLDWLLVVPQRFNVKAQRAVNLVEIQIFADLSVKDPNDLYTKLLPSSLILQTNFSS